MRTKKVTVSPKCNEIDNSKQCTLMKKEAEKIDEKCLQREEERVVSRLQAATREDDDHCASVILLAEYAYDAARSGTNTQYKAILQVLKETLSKINQKLSSNSSSSSRMTWSYLKSLSKSAFLLALSGVSIKELFEDLSTYMLNTFYMILSKKKKRITEKISPGDYFLIVDNLAAAGYRDTDVAITILLKKLEEQVQDGSDYRSLSDRGELFHISGYGLQTLWLHSTKQKKIRTAQGTSAARGNGILVFKEWEGDIPTFDNDSKQLIVDIGCGFGVTLLGMANNDRGNGTKTGSKYNYIGCDLSVHAINYARGLSRRWGLSERCKYTAAPALEFLTYLKRFYPGEIVCILIQFPSPFKFTGGDDLEPEDYRGNYNRQLPANKDDASGFMVTPTLIKSVLECIANRGLLYVQSNVEDVAVFMKHTVESCAKDMQGLDLRYTHKVDKTALNCMVITSHGESQSKYNNGGHLNVNANTCTHSMTKRCKAYHATGGELAAGEGWYDQGTSPLALYARTETETSYAIQNKNVYRIAWTAVK